VRTEWIRATDCPRCSGRLRERHASRKWCRYFECGECWATFEAVIERRWEPCALQSSFRKFLRHTITLQPGRSRSAIRRSK
jgi:hypothetical protein